MQVTAQANAGLHVVWAALCAKRQLWLVRNIGPRPFSTIYVGLLALQAAVGVGFSWPKSRQQALQSHPPASTLQKPPKWLFWLENAPKKYGGAHIAWQGATIAAFGWPISWCKQILQPHCPRGPSKCSYIFPSQNRPNHRPKTAGP